MPVRGGSARGPSRPLPVTPSPLMAFRRLTLSCLRQCRPRNEGHPPGIMADISMRARRGEAGGSELCGDFSLAVALQPDARAQLPVVGEGGREQALQRILEKAVLRRKPQQRIDISRHADLGAEDIAEQEAAGGFE